jgi:hypothetical protein
MLLNWNLDRENLIVKKVATLGEQIKAAADDKMVDLNSFTGEWAWLLEQLDLWV